jgi:hypothetical protein
MRKTSFLAASILAFSLFFVQNTALAQHDKARSAPPKSEPQPKTEDADFKRWYTGGNVSFNFLNGGFAANLSPQVGYRLKPKFMVGAGLVGVGVSQEIDKNINAFYGQYGASAFTRYDIFNGVFAHAELEQTWNSRPTSYNSAGKVAYKITPLPAALAGLGINFGLGPVRFNATALYNFLYNSYGQDQVIASKNSFNNYQFGPLVVRGGIGIGF